MKKVKIFGSILLTLLFVACDNAIEDNSNEVVDADSTSIQGTSELNTEVQEEVKYDLLEDYAALDTKTKLYEAFDKANISEDTSWYAEGTVMLLSSTLINPNNTQTIRFVWSEKDNEQLSMLEAFYTIYEDYEAVGTQKVMSECGIYTGMPLSEYEDWNGSVITFSGFGWDYGGSVSRLEGSNIAMCDLITTLDFDYEAASNDQISAVTGDMMVSSDLPTVQAVNPFISSLTLHLEDEENF